MQTLPGHCFIFVSFLILNSVLYIPYYGYVVIQKFVFIACLFVYLSSQTNQNSFSLTLGKNFDLVTMKESTDFKRLASRCTSTYARMIDDGFTAERGLTLTNLTINDAGEYLCALYDKKTHWFEFGGTITLVAKEDMRNSIPPNEGKSRPLANLPPTEISSNTIPLEKSTSIVSNPVQMKDEFSNYNMIKSQKLILEKLENNIPDTTPRTSHLSQRKPNEKKPHVLIITLAVGIPCVIFFLGSAFIIYYHKKMEAAISYTLLTDHNEDSCHDSSDEEDVKYER